MHCLPIARLQQLKHRLPDPQPHGLPVQVAIVPQLVGTLRGLKLGVRAVLVDQ